MNGRTLLGFSLTALAAVFLMPFCMIPFLLRLFGFTYLSSFIMYKFAQYISKFLLFSIGCKTVVRGKENIPAHKKNNSGLCFVCNHCSIVDILLLFSTVGQPVGFIAKKEIIFVPMINIWVLLLGGIFLDRKSPRKALKTIDESVHRIKRGHSIVVFPEGTRSRGRGLLPFKSGSFKIAVDSLAPVIPAAITGTYEAFEKTGLVQAETLYISFGKTIINADFDAEYTRQALSDKARAVIETMLAEQKA